MSGTSLDRFMSWEWHETDRHCWHAVQAVWLELTGFDIGDRTPRQDSPISRIRAFRSGEREFRAVTPRTDPSIVLMAPVRSRVPHVGVFTGGRVFHLDRGGAFYERLNDLTERFNIKGWYRP